MEILNHPLFFLAIALTILTEFLYSKKKQLNNYNMYESFSNLVFIIIDKLLAYFTGTDGGAVSKWLYDHRLFTIELNSFWKYLGFFLLVDFLYFANHWYHHHINIGWATHIMHHCPTKYNLSISYRLGITRFISLGWLVYVPAILIGFDPQQIISLLAMILLGQFFIHTELIPYLGPLEYILNTPRNHQIHHSSNPSDFNMNLGGVTMIFDHLFGTYKANPPENKLNYGMPEIMSPHNIWFEITYQWKKVLTKFWSSKGFFKKILALFGPVTE